MPYKHTLILVKFGPPATMTFLMSEIVKMSALQSEH